MFYYFLIYADSFFIFEPGTAYRTVKKSASACSITALLVLAEFATFSSCISLTLIAPGLLGDSSTASLHFLRSTKPQSCNFAMTSQTALVSEGTTQADTDSSTLLPETSLQRFRHAIGRPFVQLMGFLRSHRRQGGWRPLGDAAKISKPRGSART